MGLTGSRLHARRASVSDARPSDLFARSLSAPARHRSGISSRDAAAEREADDLANLVMRMPPAVAATQPGRCAACEHAQPGAVQAKQAPEASRDPALDMVTAMRAADRGGTPLSPELRSYFEPRFGHDFSHVRIHADGDATTGARAIQARAFTRGTDIVFGQGQYLPHSSAGRWLLAHELAHVVQQGMSGDRNQVQRCPDAASNAIYDGKAAAIKAHPEYAKLVPADKARADQILVDAKTKPNCMYYIDNLKLLFDTPDAVPAVVSAQTKAATVTADAAEQKRLTRPAPAAVKKGAEVEADKTGIEEGAAGAGRVWTKVPGKFGGGTYAVDKRDPLNIVVRAKVLLVKKGTGADADITAIKNMEDAIEKSASTTGYVVDIEFVNAPEPEAFKVDVDPSTWEVATNWSGGKPRGFAHELHHLFAFVLDRYDYVAHATNQSMKRPERLTWFSKELTKPANYNNPASLMGHGDHPLDDDACTVAGLPVAACVAARTKMNQAFDNIFKKYGTFDERILNSITSLQADPDTMMGVLRELFRRMVGFPEVKKRIATRAKAAGDAFGKTFQTLKAAQQAELLGIITP